MKSHLLVVVFLSAAVLVSCNAGDNKSEEKTIVEVIESIIAADAQADIETVISIYCDDAILLPPGKEPVSGKEKIKAHYKELFATQQLKFETKIEKVLVGDGWAIARGVNTGLVISKQDSTERQVYSKFMMILEKNDTRWQIKELIWN